MIRLAQEFVARTGAHVQVGFQNGTFYIKPLNPAAEKIMRDHLDMAVKMVTGAKEWQPFGLDPVKLVQGQLSQPKTFGQALEETLADEQDQLDGIILFLEEELDEYNDFLHVLQNSERGFVSELDSAFEDYDSDRMTFADWQRKHRPCNASESLQLALNFLNPTDEPWTIEQWQQKTEAALQRGANHE